LLAQLIVEEVELICNASTILAVALWDTTTVTDVVLLVVVGTFVKFAVILPVGPLT
jgi:hypothetical protein